MQITVVGLGYVGLVTAACLARLGHAVVGIDSDGDRITALAEGRVPYYEPGMDVELEQQIRANTLTFTTNPAEALGRADAILICVGTPSDSEGRADLAAVLAVADTIAEYATGTPLIVLRSTVPVGTTQRVEDELNRARRTSSESAVAVIANPEFLRTGRAIEDFLRPSRVVVGLTQSARPEHLELIRAMYRAIDAPTIVTDAESAELIKNAANAFLATKVSFANEIARLCEGTGADVDHVLAGVSADPRIGTDFLRPGLGYGGSCLPKDVRSLISMGRDVGLSLTLAEAVNDLNNEQPAVYADLINEALGDGLAGKRVAMLGLSFKPETDDIRDSPSLALARCLRDRGASVVGCDPVAGERVRRAEPWLEIAESVEVACRDADVVVLATEWPAYVTENPATFARAMRGRVVVDGRNVLDADSVRHAGLMYVALGRSTQPIAG